MKKPHAIVTGAARGIGLAITKKLLRDVFTVSAIDIDPVPLKKMSLPGATSCTCDAGNPEQVKSTLKTILKNHGTPWALINNAGFGGPFHRIDEVSDEEWTRIFDINVRSVFLFCRELLPRMAAQKGGRIVNIASIQGFLGAERSSTYSASKHAVIGYTRAIAAEWGPQGIACNAISPGYVDTAQGARDELARDFQNRVIQRTPSRRILAPGEIAELASFLCRKPGSKEPRTGAINGAVLTIDGGITAETGLR
jgi:3-oxoacyl-[acyl-carrier protein] reductase